MWAFLLAPRQSWADAKEAARKEEVRCRRHGVDGRRVIARGKCPKDWRSCDAYGNGNNDKAACCTERSCGESNSRTAAIQSDQKKKKGANWLFTPATVVKRLLPQFRGVPRGLMKGQKIVGEPDEGDMRGNRCALSKAMTQILRGNQRWMITMLTSCDPWSGTIDDISAVVSRNKGADSQRFGWIHYGRKSCNFFRTFDGEVE